MNAATLLMLMRLASPSLPVGGFSYSEGIESAVEAGQLSDEAGAVRWLGDQLHLGLARSELPVVARALAAWRDRDLASIAALDLWFRSTRETSELRQQSEQTGRSLALWLRNRGAASDGASGSLDALAAEPTWPICFALACAEAGASTDEALLAFASGWAENLVQAAMKSVPLGQRVGQRVLDALALEIPAAVEAALALPVGDMQSFMPMLAVLSSQHETQYSRLFRS